MSTVVPGTREGYQVIEELTARGIATNNTLSFTVPQFVACMDAVQSGLEKARKNKVDLSAWRSVITHMSARYGALGDLKAQADARKIDLSEAEIRWAELLIFKRAYRMLQERKHPSKMLMCSMRISPPMSDGSQASWHIEKIAGSDVAEHLPPGLHRRPHEGRRSVLRSRGHPRGSPSAGFGKAPPPSPLCRSL